MTSPMRVLIVEDNHIIANDLAEELENRGMHSIQMATCLRDAVRAVDMAFPDVAIVDLTLSDGETGAQIARALARSGVKVCILSGQSTPESILMSVSHTFIKKPAPADVVAQVVESFASMNIAQGTHQMQ
jgi:DNA-binding NtrC family response regulator